jgi:glutamate racemase
MNFKRNPMAARNLSAPRVTIFDSGLGGLTLLQPLRQALPQAAFTYIADTAVFPYGDLSLERLEERVLAVLQTTLQREPDVLVIACNTAATVVLPTLRLRFAFPIVGTVPAVKPAAALSKTGVIAILATKGTIARAYTQALIEEFASHCFVQRVGSSNLARLAEEDWMGLAVSDEAIAAEIAPCFVEINNARTDVVALSCTHYPLLLPRLETLAPWPVHWLDPASAITRRTVDVLGAKAYTPEKSSGGLRAILTLAPSPRMREGLQRYGFTDVGVMDVG